MEYGDIRDLLTTKDLQMFRPKDRSEVLPVSDIQVSYMKHVLKLFDGNWSQASEVLGVAVNTLKKWVDEI